MLITLDDSLPLHRQIYEKLRTMVLSGKLKADQKLPATRELARNLSVSRTTVLQAYERLAAEGYIHTRSGSATYVSTLPAPEPHRAPGRNGTKHRFVLSDSARQLNMLAAPVFQSVAPLSSNAIRSIG